MTRAPAPATFQGRGPLGAAPVPFWAIDDTDAATLLPLGTLTLAALSAALSMTPSLLHLPLPVTLGVLLILVTAVFRRVRGAAPWPLLAPVLAVGSGAALLGLFHTLLGRDGGMALLILLVAIKTLETRTKRDARMLMLFSAFLTVAGLLFGQDLQNAAMTLPALLLIAATLVTCRPGAGWDQPLRQTLRQAGLLLLQTLPLTLTLFLFFPRLSGPLWHLPGQGGARTGLGDTVEPGSVSDLAQDGSVAFRATFDGGLPAPGERYFRGPVLNTFDGRRWTAVQTPTSPQRIVALGPGVRYRLTLEGSGNSWGLALDFPGSLPPGVHLSPDLQVISDEPVTERTDLDLTSFPRAQVGLNLSDQERARDLELPDGNPRTRSLAARWRSLPDAERVRRGLSFFASDRLIYTLSPPRLGTADQVDELLYTTRQGFCEHFASSFAVLMRAAGVPTRLVTGYQGGTVNALRSRQPYLTVRQSDAHAWTEVWLTGQGWVRADPTAQVDPGRIGSTDPSSSGVTLFQPLPGGLLGALGLRFDAFQKAWNDRLLGYDTLSQDRLLSLLHLGRAGELRWVLAFSLLLLLGLLPTLVRWPAQPTDPLRAAFLTLPTRLNLPLQAGETAQGWANRVGTAHPELAEQVRDLTEQYLTLRYAEPVRPFEQNREARVLKAAVRRVVRRRRS